MESLAEIIDCYLRFVFIRSCKFTNDKLLIEQIVFTVFLDVFCMAKKLKDVCLPVAIDIMTDATGSDLIAKKGCGPDAKLFIEDKLHLHIVEAINRLDSPERLILVLFHINKIDVKSLAAIFAELVSQIEILHSRAQRGFIENLSGFMSESSFLFARDVDKWLNLLDGCFKQDDMNRMKKVILDRLSGRERPDRD